MCREARVRRWRSAPQATPPAFLPRRSVLEGVAPLPHAVMFRTYTVPPVPTGIWRSGPDGLGGLLPRARCSCCCLQLLLLLLILRCCLWRDPRRLESLSHELGRLVLGRLVVLSNRRTALRENRCGLRGRT